MEPTSGRNEPNPNATSARRRLIRGAFSAPAALTLYSGSAFAATSLTCVARQVLTPVNPNMSASAGADVYVRVQVRDKRSGQNRSTWVFGGDLLVAATLTTGQASNSFLGTDNWYCLTAGNNIGNTSGFTAGLVYTNSTATANPGGTPTLTANSYVAMRVDSSGKIVGVTTSANASAVSRSCWTSFSRTL